MERCEGYYRLENRRCDRPGARHVTAADGETYFVCSYHARQGWAASVARWHDESDVRASAPVDLRLDPAACNRPLQKEKRRRGGSPPLRALLGLEVVAVIPGPRRRGPRALYRQSRTAA